MPSSHTIPASEDSDVSIGWKRGVRVLGVSESFARSDTRSIVAGIVMRGDLRMDGFGLCRPTVGGRDATEQLVALFKRLARDDIRAIILGGGVISWFNVIDLPRLYESTGVPVLCVSFEESEGLEKYIREYFPDDCDERIETLTRSGERTLVPLQTGHSVYLIVHGIGLKRAKQLLNLFTIDGRVPEPVRVARHIAAGIHRDMEF